MDGYTGGAPMKQHPFDNKYCNQCGKTTKHELNKDNKLHSHCVQCGTARQRQISKRIIKDDHFKR